jgi:hypothetical protein
LRGTPALCSRLEIDLAEKISGGAKDKRQQFVPVGRDGEREDLFEYSILAIADVDQ